MNDHEGKLVAVTQGLHAPVGNPEVTTEPGGKPISERSLPNCMVPGCTNGRAEDHVACAHHWHMIPEDERRAYWATKPYSDERRGALLRVLRFMFREAKAATP